MFKKSLYIFLAALLGVLLFLILHRAAVFFYLYLLLGGYVTTSLTYVEFLIIDYFTLTFTLMIGAWYGIWIGLGWYDKVYVEKTHPGFVAHLGRHLFGHRRAGLQQRMSQVKQRLEADLWQLEDLANVSLEEGRTVVPVKRTVVRKAAPKKLKTSKV